MLIPALMLSASLMADNEKYEVTPVIGYNFVENNLALDDAMLYGVEAQYNGFDYVLKPELVKRGVEADRIETDGMGEENPIADNSTKEGRAKNRRIKATLIKN